MRVSVAVCTYNGEEYLRDQVDSIIDQSNVPDQIVVCDDGSTDDTTDILESYQVEYPETIEVYENSDNIGVSQNFSKAIGKCDGDIVFLADQDDIWKENKIKKHCECHEQNNADIVFNNSLVVDEKLNPIATHWSTSSYQFGIAQDSSRCFAELLKYNFIKGCEMSITSRLKKHVYPIPDNVPHDYFIGIVGSVTGSMIDIEEPLHLYRRHRNNESDWKTNQLKKHLSSALSVRDADEFSSDIKKWGQYHDHISAIPDEEMILDKKGVLQQISNRQQFEKRRYEIYHQDGPLLSRYKSLTQNFLDCYYHNYSVEAPSLYVIKDLLKATTPR